MWKQVEPGIWKTVVGQPDKTTPLAVMACEPRKEALLGMGEAAFPFSGEEIDIDEQGGRTIVRLPLLDKEELYGMGLQFMKLNQRGRTRVLRVNSDPRQDTGETHAPVPWMISSRGYGLLVNTSRIVTFHCGSTVLRRDTASGKALDRNTDPGWKATPVSGIVEVELPREGAELLLFAGPTVAQVVQRYNLYCGGGTLPPKWGLGFWHRVPKLYKDEEVLAEALEFRKRGYPCDVIGLEPGWHSASYPVTNEWSEERFPQPAAFLDKMKEHHFRVNLWEHPYISPESKLHEPLSPLSGSHTVWGGLAPDYSLEQARGIYQKQHEDEHIDLGVSGYKLDECDGSELTRNSWMFPAHTRFPSGLDGEQMRQLYGLLFQKMTLDSFRSRNRRTYGLVRASGSAASSLPYVLYSDLYDHKQFVRALCNASFSGLLWTPEVRSAANEEDWIRRMQTVCFSPMAMLNAWGDGTKPWSYPEAEQVVKHYIRLRMRLLPYLYSAFARYREDGTPPFRAMALEMGQPAGEDEQKSASQRNKIEDTAEGAYGNNKIREWDDQYMMGDSILVAPLFAGEEEREVYLPPGVWYGFESGERWDGGQVIRVKPGLERIPLFVKEGAVIPMVPAADYVISGGNEAELTIVHFGNKPGSFRLYEDDGESFAYEQGQYQWREISVSSSSDGAWQGVIEGSDKAYSYAGKISWKLRVDRIAADTSS